MIFKKLNTVTDIYTGMNLVCYMGLTLIILKAHLYHHQVIITLAVLHQAVGPKCDQIVA